MSYIKYEVRVYDDGTKEWWLDGKRHRTDGPAAEHADGTKEWWLDGKRHRTDGPAFEAANGGKWWHLDGLYMSEDQFNARTKLSCSGKVVEIDGKKYKLTEII